MSQKIKHEIVQFVENTLFPIYDNFDGGHDSRHIRQTIDRALKIADYVNKDISRDMLYLAAAMHDIGMQVSREGHAKHSGEIVRRTAILHDWFSEEEIETIAQAVEDHSTSSGRKPRSIYGEIVSDADKDNDVSISLLRAYRYTREHNPDYSEEECFRNVFSHLNTKFGDNGLVSLHYLTPVHKGFCNTMHGLSRDYELFSEKMKEALERMKGEK